MSASDPVAERVAAVLLRLCRARCGEFGGQMERGVTRWCTKRFGHIDSCAFEPGQQPLSRERRRRRGWPS